MRIISQGGAARKVGRLTALALDNLEVVQNINLAICKQVLDECLSPESIHDFSLIQGASKWPSLVRVWVGIQIQKSLVPCHNSKRALG